ncbi:cell division protein SepF [Clostridia bacterium]|nr:cell division protein SepF [Clostridia bacterium]
MPSLVDKFKRMWDAPDEEYEDFDEEFDGEYSQREEGDGMSQTGNDYQYGNDIYSSRGGSSSPQKNKVVNISATAKLQVVLFKPTSFGEETRTIADELKKTHTVVLNLEKANRDQSCRIIDFLSGCAYANGGKIKRIATSTFIIIPNNVDLTGDDLLDELENSGVYF